MKNNVFKDSVTGLEFIISDKDQFSEEEATFAAQEYIRKQKEEGLKKWLKKNEGFKDDLNVKAEEIWQIKLRALTTQQVPILLYLKNVEDTE